MVRNAASLFGSTISTSVVGFFFWFLAARLLPPSAVGTASAIQSATQILGYVCVFGLGTLAIAELSEMPEAARQLITTTVILTSSSGLVVGVAVGFVLGSIHTDVQPELTSAAHIALFAGLSSMATTALLVDDICIGLLRGGIQLRRNTIFAVTKLVLLVAIAGIWHWLGGTSILLAWLGGIAISLLMIRGRLGRATASGSWRPSFRALFAKRRLMYSHHWLNLSIIAPRQVLPFLVATIVSPAANAGFYAASLVVSFVNIIPTQLSTAMFALAPGDERALRDEVRETMKICVVLSALSGPFFALAGGHILEVFGRSYVRAAPAMTLLGFATLPSAIKAYYVNISRVRGHMRRAARRTSLAALAEVALSSAGAKTWGVTGVALGLLLAYALEACWFGPTVIRVIRSPHRPGRQRVVRS